MTLTRVLKQFFEGPVRETSSLSFFSRLSNQSQLFFCLFILLSSGFSLFSLKAFCGTFQLPASLLPEVVAETSPLAWALDDMRLEDFEVKWVKNTIPGASAKFVLESMEWVRVYDLFVIPRARLGIKIPGIQQGTVSYFNKNQVFAPTSSESSSEIPVALFSSQLNRIRVVVQRNGKIIEDELVIKFLPKTSKQPVTRNYIDSSCSPYKIDVKLKESKTPRQESSWSYTTCRMVYTHASIGRVPNLEIFVLWDQNSQDILLNGIPTHANSDSIWAFSNRTKPGHFVLESRNQGTLQFSYRVNETLNLAFLGIGIGPYHYEFDAQNLNTSAWVPLVTLYGSYFISDSIRFTGFNATAINKNYFSDTGFYVNTESFRIFDRRVSLSLMLGAHVILFKTKDGNEWKWGIPQGVEIIFKDFFKRGYNGSTGAFILPRINGKSYTNAWIRWGNPSLFGEFNYISWEEPLEKSIGNRAFSKSIGICIGFPIARFL